jgi:hypothetical protein
MKIRSLSGALAALALLGSLGGCVVVPAGPRPVVAQPVYVEPAYPAPGPGWVWITHPRHGSGWRHPRHGWHRGWHD